MGSIGYSDSGIGDDMTCISIDVEGAEDHCGYSVRGGKNRILDCTLRMF